MIEEGVERIRTCLSKLTEEEIWYRPNTQLVSVGNLVLHLCGNVRQWILSGLAGAADHRDRPAEFSEKGPIPATELMAGLEELMHEVEDFLQTLEPEDLIGERVVQGFRETGMGILIHVTEHFSYHVGQIGYYVKWIKETDLKYYDGMDL